MFAELLCGAAGFRSVMMTGRAGKGRFGVHGRFDPDSSGGHSWHSWWDAGRVRSWLTLGNAGLQPPQLRSLPLLTSPCFSAPRLPGVTDALLRDVFAREVALSKGVFLTL